MSWEIVFDDFWGESPKITAKMGSSCAWCVLFIVLLNSSLFNFCLYNLVFLLIFAVSDRPKLESWYREWVCLALAFAKEIEHFDDLVNPHHLFDCYVGLEPSKYVLEKIRRKEKSKFIFAILRINLFSLASSLLCLIANLTFWLAKMATRYRKEKYARIRGMKNESLSSLVVESKKRKIGWQEGWYHGASVCPNCLVFHHSISWGHSLYSSHHSF